MQIELTARPGNGLQLAMNIEQFQPALVSDRFFLHTGMEEEELWDHMANVKTQPGFVQKYK